MVFTDTTLNLTVKNKRWKINVYYSAADWGVYNVYQTV